MDEELLGAEVEPELEDADDERFLFFFDLPNFLAFLSSFLRAFALGSRSMPAKRSSRGFCPTSITSLSEETVCFFSFFSCFASLSF